MPDKSTSYSTEGSIAHAMAEFLLGYYLTCNCKVFPYEPIEGLIHDIKTGANYALATGCRAHIQKAEEEGFDGYEMLACIHDRYVKIVYETYLGALLEDPNAELRIEARLNLSEFIPEGFGSADAVIIYRDTLEVFDLKYGKGVKVDADENPQMLCYAIGAYCGPAETYDIEKVRMTIIQPRLNHGSTYELTSYELLDWAYHTLKPAAQKAYNSEGAMVPGEHCRFCKVAAQCKALADYTLKVTDDPAEPGLMTLEQIADLLPHFSTIKTWMTRVEEFALEAALDGKSIPGFKVVEGRSIRKIANSSEAQKRLEEGGFAPEDYLKPQELKTITDLEKALTKKGFNALLGDLVIKPEGKPTLVEEADPRKPLSKAAKDFECIIDNL